MLASISMGLAREAGDPVVLDVANDGRRMEDPEQ